MVIVSRSSGIRSERKKKREPEVKSGRRTPRRICLAITGREMPSRRDKIFALTIRSGSEIAHMLPAANVSTCELSGFKLLENLFEPLGPAQLD